MTKPFSVQRIVCPIDFSPASEPALHVAEAIARSFGARIDLLHVWAPPIAMALDVAMLPSPEDIVRYTAAMETGLAAAAKKLTLPADRLDRHLIQGIAWRDIIEFAKEKSADLIVMSTHGRTGLAHLMMGSIAERVVRSSSVPVLVVPSAR